MSLNALWGREIPDVTGKQVEPSHSDGQELLKPKWSAYTALKWLLWMLLIQGAAYLVLVLCNVNLTVITIISTLLMYAVWFIGEKYTTYKAGVNSFSKDYGLVFKKYDFLWGLMWAAVVLVAVNGAGILFGDVLGFDMSSANNEQNLNFGTGWAAFWLLSIPIGGILAPFCEELFFRGFLLRGVLESYKHFRERILIEGGNRLQLWFAVSGQKLANILAIIVSGFVFGLLHYQGVSSFGGWFLLGATTSIGLLFAVIALKTQRLGVNIMAHSIYNTVTLLVAFYM